MMELLDNNICSHLVDIKEECRLLVKEVPYMIKEYENKNSVNVICINRHYCEKPIIYGPDPQDVPTYVINLDLPPALRWRQICSNSTYKLVMGEVLAGLRDLFGNGSALSDLGRTLNLFYFPAELGAELRGCAEEMGVDFGWLSLFNMGYEVTDACTSILAQTLDNKILHVRNMDFWDGIWLTNHLKNLTIQVDYQTKGKTLFHATTFAGYVGVLSGMKPQGFSISIDTRNYPGGPIQLFYEVVAAITEKNASLVAFLTRHVLTRINTFEDAVANLSNDLLIADVYYIVGGVSAGEGAVVTRNRHNATDVWRLQTPDRWYEVQTNYDHWNRPPWYDNRVDPAEHAMDGVGRAGLSLDALFHKVLSVKPVLNLQTTFTMLACSADDTYKSYARNCPYPCAE
jgi:acid ceramidase